jgi:hypothetical protein
MSRILQSKMTRQCSATVLSVGQRMAIPSRNHGLLSVEERTLLRSLRGQDVFIAFSPWINATFQRFDCGPLSFALQSSSGFIVLDTVWEEDEALTDFGWMTVRAAERAKGIEYSATLELASSVDGAHLERRRHEGCCRRFRDFTEAGTFSWGRSVHFLFPLPRRWPTTFDTIWRGSASEAHG